MVNTSEEILLTMNGQDNASQMFANIDKNAQSMASSISAAMSKVNSGLMNLSQVGDNVVQSLTGKSALDNILGSASKNETNMVLLENMLEDVEANYDSFYKTVDTTTDKSLTSMQELIPALNALNAATGATDKELENITPNVANFGAAVLAQTGSVDRAQQAMMDLSKGYKGAYASLDQYGITEDALARAGYNEGDGLEKYMDAVTKVVGSTDKLMETNQGLDALIGKSFSRAGKKIGNEFLPIIKDVKRGFIDLDSSLGGAIAGSILLGEAGVEAGNRIMWNVSTAAQGVRDLKDGFVLLKDTIKGVGRAAEEAGDAINTISNVSDIGAGAAGLGGAAGAGAQATKTVSKSEKAVDVGVGAMGAADLINNTKSESKEIEQLQKELDRLNFHKQRITEELDYTAELSSNMYYSKTTPKSHAPTKSPTAKTLEAMIEDNKSVREDAGKLLNELDDFKSVGNELEWSMDYAQSGFLDKLRLRKDKGVKGNISDAFTGIKSFFKGAEEVTDVVDEAEDIAVTLKGADAIGDGMMAAATAGEAATVAGPAMEAGAVGAEAAAAGATGLSAAFTSMIVPLLALSATIIIMIPIAAVIAAEAMIILRLLAELMEALNFDSINLDGAVKGISSVTMALLWVGAAMLALTAVNIATQLAMVTSFFMGLNGPLDKAIDALKQAATKLSVFNSIKVDPSVATNLKTIGDSLTAISSAMGALTWSNITTGFSNFIADILGFSSVTDGLEQAKNDIMEASTKLNEFSGLTPLDDKVANNIQNVCDSLASVGNAMSALRSIRDDQNWDDLIGGFISGIFGEGLDIQQALLNVKEDIVKASAALAQFTGITEIPDDVATKIQKVSDTLSSVSEAFKTLRSMRDDSNWDEWMNGIFGGTDIASALEQVKTDLMTASQKLAELSGLSEISEDTTNKIKLVGDALVKVSEVCTTLSQLPPMEDFDSTQITNAVTNVQTAATELAKLNEIAFDGGAADTILGAIQTTLENVKTTLSSASGFSEASTSIGGQIVSGVQSGISPLPSTVQGAVSSAISSAGPQATSGGNMLGTNATNGMKSTLQLKSTMATEVGYALQAMTSKTQEFYDAGAALGKAAKDGFESVGAINPGSPGNLAHTMMDEVGYILEAMKSKYSAAYNMAAGLGKSIFEGFGNPNLDFDMFMNNGTLTADYIGALQTTISRAPDKQDNRPVTIIVSEGAVKLDARNYTTKEAQGLMITAFEGMDNITKIDVNGV